MIHLWRFSRLFITVAVSLINSTRVRIFYARDSLFALWFSCKIKGPISKLDISDRSEEIRDRNCVRIAGKEVRPFSDRRYAKSLRADFEELAHGRFGVPIDLLQELKGVVGVPVDDVYADGRVNVVRQRVLAH